MGQIACLPEPLIKLRRHKTCVSYEDGGRLQQLMGFAAIVCHFRRKAGLSDLSQMDDKVWREFLVWLETLLGKKGLFDEHRLWQAIRKAWYNNHSMGRITSTMHFISYILKNPLLFGKKIKGKLLGTNLPQQIVLESTNIWPR